MDCLASIYRHQVSCSFEIIVVDNNSSDGSVMAVQNTYPAVKIIQNKNNVGFAAANNLAIKNSQSRYIFLLNPDTLIHENTLDCMLEFINNHNSVGAVGPKIINADGSIQYTGMRFPNIRNMIYETLFLDRIFSHSKIFGNHKMLYEDFNTPFPVDYTQGSALMIRRSVLDGSGLLDERYFMYFEETDLCFFIKKLGYEVFYFPGARATHFGGEERGHFSERRLLHYHKSLFQFYRKNYLSKNLLLLRIVIFIRSSIRIFLWSGILLFKPSSAKNTFSILKGYLKTLRLIFTA